MSGLTKRQDLAILALLSTATVADAAAKAGVAEVTVLRWLKLPEFLAEFRRARSEIVEQSIIVLQRTMLAAVMTLHASLSAKSEGVRLRAATAIIDLGMRGVELMDLESRIATLETKADGSTK